MIASQRAQALAYASKEQRERGTTPMPHLPPASGVAQLFGWPITGKAVGTYYLYVRTFMFQVQYASTNKSMVAGHQ